MYKNLDGTAEKKLEELAEKVKWKIEEQKFEEEKREQERVEKMVDECVDYVTKRHSTPLVKTMTMVKLVGFWCLVGFVLDWFFQSTVNLLWVEFWAIISLSLAGLEYISNLMKKNDEKID